MNPSDTASRVNTPRTDAALMRLARHNGAIIDLAGTGEIVPASHARALETELNTLANHPSDEVNRRYIVPLQVAYASAMAERDRLAEQKAQLLSALKSAAISLYYWEGRAAPNDPARQETNQILDGVRAAIASATQPSP